ncbi:hypothetical protein HPB47_016466 [Ixodes persulcatus]|uniref:Uncharacterized protein n=1 Tax=Ixodes persulcatus TaxID=34615 RepID=A0AC60QR15_IXOPE|nr:hypothetical protein HPB47_016466 [Ixodes persulcatus]
MFAMKSAFQKHHLFDIPNKPPIPGRCAVDPPRGVAVRDLFTFECKGFADPERRPLLYEFYFCFRHPNQLASPAGQGIDPRRECNLMKSARNQQVFQGVLPLGNLKQSATVSVLIYVSDNVGQFIRVVVPVDLIPLTCSNFRLEPANQYAHTAAAGASQVMTYMRTTSKMMNSEFFDSCDTGPSLQEEEEQRRGYLEYLKKTDTKTEGDLRTQAEAFRDIVSQKRANLSRTFKDEAVTLLSGYAQKFDELTNANDSDRVPEKTAAVGQVLISGMKMMLHLTAPTDVAKPGAVSKMEDTCTSAETIVANMAHVAEGVTRVVDTIDSDREMRVDDYEIWMRDSKRQGYLGSENGTKVRINGAVNQLTTIVFPSNPFNCGNSSRFSNTQAVLIDVKNGTHGSSKFSRSGVNIVLKRPEALVFEDRNDTFHTSFAIVSIHTIVVTQPGVYVKIEVAPVNDEDQFITAVTMNRLPTSQDFLKQNLRNLLFHVPREVRFVSVPDRGTLTLAVYPLTNETKRKLQDRLYKSSEDFINVSYTLRSVTYSCLLWNSTRQTWATSGCRVLHFSDDQYVRCACDHASVFTGGLFIAPHPIDFTNLEFLFQGMSSNLVMTIVVAVVWVLYGVVMVWSFQQDARDEGAAGIEYLSENNSNDAFGYLLSFYTWFRSGAGTSSKVSIKIHGSQDDSRAVVIRDGGKNPFALQAGGRDWYFLSHPTSLGTVETIDITVDQKGKNPPWTLSTIVIRDLQTSSRTIFLIDKKLRPDAETGTSTFTFEPTSASVLRSPLRIFKARVIRYFREDHLILSIFSRLPTGNFTRKQRASVALLLVVSGMMVCLMFYGLNADEDEIFRSDIFYTLLEVPPLSEVIIAMQSSAIVTPFVLLVLFLFERSRPPFLHRKSIVPKVAVDGSVQEWLDDDAKSASSSPTGKVPKELLTNSATNYIFPKWASITAWVLCIGGSIIISIFIILYGLTYGYYRSLSWLRCNMFNVIVTEFIVHPVKLIVMSAIMAGIFRTPLEMENIPLRFIE